MKHSKKINGQSGFSLVELMVVVAIIGILAALSVGQVQKQIAKARQSEVKTNLAAIYTSEKAFAAEFSTFNEDWSVLGFGLDGNVRYNVGFADAATGHAAAVAAGYSAPAPAATYFDAVGFCPGVGTCTIIDSNGVTPPASAGDVTAADRFVAEGTANIFEAATADTWTINEAKAIINTAAGIP